LQVEGCNPKVYNLQPVTFIFMRRRVRHQAHEGLSPKYQQIPAKDNRFIHASSNVLAFRFLCMAAGRLFRKQNSMLWWPLEASSQYNAARNGNFELRHECAQACKT
jgi:hypothetical protein